MRSDCDGEESLRGRTRWKTFKLNFILATATKKMGKEKLFENGLLCFSAETFRRKEVIS